MSVVEKEVEPIEAKKNEEDSLQKMDLKERLKNISKKKVDMGILGGFVLKISFLG